MSSVENKNANETASGNDTPKIDDLPWKEWSKVGISELVPRTFDDHSRLNDPKRASELFDAFGESLDKWLDNYRAGIKLSRVVAVAMLRLRSAVTDLNGDPIWAIKGTTAWKVIYQDRIEPYYASILMNETEITALKASVKTYIADRNLLDAVIAERCIYVTPGLGSAEWDVKGKKITIKKAIETLLGDDQKAASEYEGLKYPADLKKAIESEYKRQKVLTGPNTGKRKQGFEKVRGYFGPTLETSTRRAAATNQDDPNPAGNPGHATAKSHSDALRELLTSGSISVHAYVEFLREQMATLNAEILRKQQPKGGNKAGIVKMLDDNGLESRLLADWYRPGDDKKPSKEQVNAAAVELPTA